MRRKGALGMLLAFLLLARCAYADTAQDIATHKAKAMEHYKQVQQHTRLAVLCTLRGRDSEAARHYDIAKEEYDRQVAELDIVRALQKKLRHQAVPVAYRK